MTAKIRRLNPTLLFVAIVAAMVLAAAGCSGDEEKPTINIADQSFEPQWFNNALAEFIIEEGYGYPVETVEVSTPIMQVALAEGDLDLNLEMYQQNFIDNYNEEIAAGNYVNLGPTYEGGPQFFIVPKATAEEFNIKTVEDMKQHWELVKDPEDPTKGEFQNCPIGWQCAEINRAKIEAYGLDEFFNIKSGGSQAALDAALVGAQKKGEPVFGYYWAPTSIMGAYDWTILEEPTYTAECWAEVSKGQLDPTYTPKEACAYEALPVDKVVNGGMLEKAPDVVEMLKKMHPGVEALNAMGSWALENDIQGDWGKAAVNYLQNFEDTWTTWMPAENAQKVKDALGAL